MLMLSHIRGMGRKKERGTPRCSKKKTSRVEKMRCFIVLMQLTKHTLSTQETSFQGATMARCFNGHTSTRFAKTGLPTVYRGRLVSPLRKPTSSLARKVNLTVEGTVQPLFHSTTQFEGRSENSRKRHGAHMCGRQSTRWLEEAGGGEACFGSWGQSEG